MTSQYAGRRSQQRRTDADQAAYAARLVALLRGRPVNEIADFCASARAARGLDTRTAAAICDAIVEAARRHPPTECRRCRRPFHNTVGGVWRRYCSQDCANADHARSVSMRQVNDPHILYAEQVDADGQLQRLTVTGRRPTGHPSTVTVDLSTLDDAAVDLFAAAVLIVLRRRWPREAALLDHAHDHRRPHVTQGARP